MDNVKKLQLPSFDFVIKLFWPSLYWKTVPIFESLKEPVHPSCTSSACIDAYRFPEMTIYPPRWILMVPTRLNSPPKLKFFSG